MSKKADADAAYRKQEVQRALAHVIAAAERDARDSHVLLRAESMAAIELVRAEYLTVTAPSKSMELPGQLGLDGSAVGMRETGLVRHVTGAPDECPSCHASLLVVHGGGWSPLSVLAPERPERAIQCGFCAHVVQVTVAVHDAVVRRRRAAISHTDAPPPKKSTRGAKQRGAG